MMKLGTEVGLGAGHIVLDGDPSPPKMGTATINFRPMYSLQSPNFQPMSVVAKRLDASEIRIPFGTEVGLGRADIVLDGDPALPQRATAAPNFRPISVVAKRLYRSGCHLVRR